MAFTWSARAASPTGYAAMCVLEATSLAPGPITGQLQFVELSDTTLNVSLVVSGLSNGTHGFQVHMYGDISSPTAAATGGHFIGDCVSCRPTGILQEVGMLNNGQLLVVNGSSVSLNFIETVAKFNGVNSIIGRSVVIHGTPADASVRAAQCVIGRWTEPTGAPPGKGWWWAYVFEKLMRQHRHCELNHTPAACNGFAVARNACMF